MKRSDDVFFFTLIDFLLQAIFFGLVLFALAKTAEQSAIEKQPGDKVAIDTLISVAGVSSITELTDLLTRLVPARDLRAKVGLLDSIGGWETIRKLRPLIDSVGGPDSARLILGRYIHRQDGFGKPPCNYDERDRRRVPRSVASVSATDTLIRFDAETPALDSALSLLGLSYQSIAVLSLNQFKQTFLPLTTLRADCRYWLQFREYTRLVDARDAARVAFTLDIRNMRDAKR